MVIVYGEHRYHDEHRAVLLNPTVIIEVLSETTKDYDRGEKFERYRTWLPTLAEYVIVHQTQPRIEYFVCQTDGGWSYPVHRELIENLMIQSIACTLHLAEVYDRIEFSVENSELNH